MEAVFHELLRVDAAAHEIFAVLVPVLLEPGEEVVTADRDRAALLVLDLHRRTVEPEELPHLVHLELHGAVDDLVLRRLAVGRQRDEHEGVRGHTIRERRDGREDRGSASEGESALFSGILLGHGARDASASAGGGEGTTEQARGKSERPAYASRRPSCDAGSAMSAESLARAGPSLYASRMRVFPAIVLVALMVVPSLAVAKPRHRAKPKAAHVVSKPAHVAPPPPVRYLGGDPIGPLAVVRDGKVSEPPRSACRTWGPAGSRWTELDAYGRPAGEVVVTGGERYDVTNCDELAVRRTHGRAGAGVYVAAPPTSATSATPPPSSPFEPSRLGETIREDLERVVAPIQ